MELSRRNAQSEDEHDNSVGRPFLLFFDSLKAHAKSKVRQNVIKWLNFEWKRLAPEGEDDEKPFASKDFGIISPRSKCIRFCCLVAAFYRI